MAKSRVPLTMEERSAWEQLVSKGKAAARKLTHARVLLRADDFRGEEGPDDEIVATLGISPRTVARVRQRLVPEEFQAALDHRPQPARPDKIKIRGDVEQKRVELACADPLQGRCRWTWQRRADEMVVLGRAEVLSLETVRQALKKLTSGRGSSRPGVSRSRAGVMSRGRSGAPGGTMPAACGTWWIGITPERG